jgi:hypothetical protein
MNTVTKVMLAGGFLLMISGTIVASGGFAELDELSKKTSDYTSDTNTEITKNYTDEDGLGSAGWLIMIEGEYVDENDNQRVDSCENMTFSVTDEKGNNVTEESSEFGCQLDDKWSDEYFDPVKGDGWIVAGYVCSTISEEVDFDCNIGESYTITSNKSMKLYDWDAMEIAKSEMFVAKVLPPGGAACGGCCLLIIGGIMALTMGKPKQPVVYQQNDGVFMVDTTKTHLSQPVLQQQHESYEPPAQTGLEPPSGGL